MTADLTATEDRLRTALRARADLVTADTLGPARPPVPAPRPHRARWVLPSLLTAAAAVLAVAAGMTVPRITASPAPPGRTDPVPPVIRAPTPPNVLYAGLGLALAAGWRLRPSPGVYQPGGSDLGSACVLRPGAPADSALADCDLQVYPLETWPHSALVDPDVPTGLRFVAATRYACGEDRPGVRDTVTVAGRTGQHRTIRLGCAHRGQTMEQWVFADRPGVVFVRAYAGERPADDAVVRQIVAGATLPAGTGQPQSDYGRLAWVSSGHGSYDMVLTRYTPRGVWSARDVPAEPRQVRPLWADDLSVFSAGSLCGEASPVSLGGLGLTDCSDTPRGVLWDRFRPGGSGAGAMVWLEYGPDGKVTRIIEDRW